MRRQLNDRSRPGFAAALLHASHSRMNQRPSFTVHEDTPARFTVDEFMHLVETAPIADWQGKVELVDGIIVRMSPANTPHWNVQRVTHARLYDVMKDEPGNWVVGIEPRIRLAGDTIREPDVALLRDPDLSGKTIDRAFLFLAIEVADSSLSIDLGAKQSDYATAFVPHYWVADIQNRKVWIMSHPSGGDYLNCRTATFGDEIDVPNTKQRISID